MLVLSRKIGERVLISDSIVVTVVAVQGGVVRLGFDAPTTIEIVREEVRSRSSPLCAPGAKRGAGSGCSTR